MAQTWLNADGLYVKFNGSAGTATTAGQYAAEGDRSITELEIDLSKLTSTAGTVLFDNVIIPKDAWIEKILVRVAVPATSSGDVDTGTFDLGLVRFDRTTEIDYDGLIQQMVEDDLDTLNTEQALTINTAGKGGDLMGTQLANSGYICGNFNTTAFTAGKVRVLIYFRMDVNDNTPGSNA